MALSLHGQRTNFIRDALVSFCAVLLAVGAFDDITTDTDTDFTVEYAALLLCALWFGHVAVKLTRIGHRTLGILTLGVLAGAALAQGTLGERLTPGRSPEYLITAGALLWCLALTTSLLFLGWRDAVRGRRR